MTHHPSTNAPHREPDTELHPSFVPGHGFNRKTGLYETHGDRYMADFRFYEVNAGDELRIDPMAGFEYQALLYGDRVDPTLIHSYRYSPEESWAGFAGKTRWRCRGWTARRHGYVRLAARKKGASTLGEDDLRAAQQGIAFLRKEMPYQPKLCFVREMDRTAQTVRQLMTADTLVFALMSDTHYVVNGGWEDTAYNLQRLSDEIHLDGIIHLGDLTDGMLPAVLTGEYVRTVLDGLSAPGVPVYMAIGNHDANYFCGNPEPLGIREQSRLYLGRDEPHYTADLASPGGGGLRLVVLQSFDHTQEGQERRYGFPPGEAEWAAQALARSPPGYCSLVLSHVPLLAKMHYWSDSIRNGPEMAQAIGSYCKRGGRTLAYIHGHTHADQVDFSLPFPVVSVGCSKPEDEAAHKTPGAVTWPRRMGDATQELWDVLLADTRTGRLDLVRFGSGTDRRIRDGRI